MQHFKRTLILILIFVKISIIQLYSLDNNASIILISLDGFRWDYLKSEYCTYLNEIADFGVKAQSLKPQFPSMTFPNHYSIITGLYPANHGIIANHFKNQIDDTYFSIKSPSVKEAIWYRGEAFWETARRNGIITASYFWPGSEMNLEYRRPNYFETYEHNRPYDERVKGVLNWLKLPDSLRPRFITLYFDETDSKGHRYGVDSDSLFAGIQKVDKYINMLDSGLIQLGLKDKINLIIVSDHGMTNLSPDKMIWINKILDNDSNYVEFNNLSSLGFLYIKDKSKINKIYEKLKNIEKNYKVYLKNNLPKRFHYDNPFIGDIIIIPDISYSLHDKNALDNSYKATHGYDNEEIDMQGIFIARGPKFKSGYKVTSLNNIDIYPLLCKIFDIDYTSKIDGDLQRIIHILKE